MSCLSARDPLTMEAAARRLLMQEPADGLGSPHEDDHEQAIEEKPKSKSNSKGKSKSKRKAPMLGVFQLREDGVYYNDPESDEEPMRICGSLKITALTRAADSENWGCLLEWHDRDGKPHKWAMAASLLAGSGEEYRRRLLDGGLDLGIGPKTRERLGIYIVTTCPAQRVTCTDRIGWHNNSFVLPDVCIHKAGAELVVYQTDSEPDHRLNVRGTADEWREHVGALCAGNSRVLLAVCCAFAGPLLEMLGVENGGIHLVCPSSKGKTTTLIVAGSVLGGGGADGYKETWRATANGIEATAEAHNDLTLLLDEIGQVDPREAGETAYLLSNGQGKTRMTRTTGLRRRKGWRLLFLSSGELTLADHSASAGKRTRGGAEVRLLNIGADAGTGMGLFEDLHGCASADAFADLLKERAQKFYGAPIRVFLENVVERRAEILKRWPEYRTAFVSEYVPQDASGEVKRAAGRLALIAYAGEMATCWGLTGWEQDEPKRAAGSALLNWIDTRGGAAAQADDETALRQVRRFIEANGSSRFEPAKPRMNNVGEVIPEKTVNRTGFRAEEPDGEIEFWILPETFRSEVCNGLDYRGVARALDKKGHLHREHPALTRKPYIGALRKDLRVFAVKSSILES
jgi:uncharacterized protein (DUF927 family)